MAGIPPRAMIVCRSLRTLGSGAVGYRMCAPSPFYPYGFQTVERETIVDGFWATPHELPPPA